MLKLGLIVLFFSGVIFFLLRDSFDPESIKGKNVVITGASTGIGEQLAYHYARLGANIVITARREKRLKEVTEKCKELGKKGGIYHHIVLDMGHKDATKQLIEFAEESLGGIDVLILNHKIPSLGPWIGSPENFTHLYETINVNFYAYVSAAAYAKTALSTSGGSIIVLSSVAGKAPNPYAASYSASKHALEGFFGSLRDEFIMSNTDICITVCTLGFIETENAMEGLQKFGATRLLSSVRAVSASDTAREIIAAGARRDQRLYFPYIPTKLTTTLYTFFPELISKVFRHIWEI